MPLFIFCKIYLYIYYNNNINIFMILIFFLLRHFLMQNVIFIKNFPCFYDIYDYINVVYVRFIQWHTSHYRFSIDICVSHTYAHRITAIFSHTTGNLIRRHGPKNIWTEFKLAEVHPERWGEKWSPVMAAMTTTVHICITHTVHIEEVAG